MGGVEGGEGDVAGGVEDDGDDVVLAGAEAEEGVGGCAPDDGRGDDLRGEVVRVGGEVLEEVFEVGGGGVGDEGGGAPVVEEGVGGGGCGQLLDEDLAGAELGASGGVAGEGEEVVGGAVVLGEAGLDGAGVDAEGGECGGGWLGEEGRVAEEKKCAEEEWELVVHEAEDDGLGVREQCKRGNARQN